MFSSRNRVILAAILVVYVLLGLIYSVAVPVFEASDERGHYPVVQYVASHGLQLPVQDPANPGLWKQEGSQPPLYYLLAALGTLSIDTSDFAVAYQPNPHADIGRVPADGNINMLVHDAAREAFPWTGTVLALHVARLLSVLMGAVTVLTTYWIGREVWPARPQVALVAAAFNAFLPMFLFISGSVNNDNLSNMVAGLLVWQIIRLLKHDRTPAVAAYVGLGALAAVALLAKLSLGFLLLFVAASLAILSVRLRTWRPFIQGGVISGGIALLGSGWWFVRNWQLYGDFTGLNVFLEVVGRRAVRADLPQLWAERESFLRAWWGLFGGINVLLPDGMYAALNWVGGIGLVGFAVFVLLAMLRRVPQSWRVDGWGLAVVVLWPLVAFGALLQWTSQTWASQGRLLFIAIGPVSLWLAVGLGWWLPDRLRRGAWIVLAALLFGLGAYVPFGVIQPAYALPELQPASRSPAAAVDEVFVEPGADAPVLRLRDAAFEATALHPGDSVTMTFDWEVMSQPSRRWSLFVHGIDSAGVIAAQRDRYPGQGLLVTERLEPGQLWRETVVIDLPETVYAPDTVSLAVGWYDQTTGERMTVLSSGETLFGLDGEIPVVAREEAGGVPNPRADNFDNLLTLAGYDLSTRRLGPGGDLGVTLYWAARSAIPRDYTVFVHVIDTPTLTIFAGSDAQPVGGAQPTSSWEVGDIIVDEHRLTLSPDTPPGVYDVEVGLYWMPEAGVFERLNVVVGRGDLSNSLVYLSRVAVVVEDE